MALVSNFLFLDFINEDYTQDYHMPLLYLAQDQKLRCLQTKSLANSYL